MWMETTCHLLEDVPNGSLVLVFKYHSAQYRKNTWVDFQKAIILLRVP